MANSVTVTIESPPTLDKYSVRSVTPSSVTLNTVPPELFSGSMRVYEMLRGALEWWMRKVDAQTRFLTEGSVYDRIADAVTAFALLEEITVDSTVVFTEGYMERVADALIGLASEMNDKLADARAYFSLLSEERIADAIVAFADLFERIADALVYFGTEEGRVADARSHHIHISDLYNIGEFLSSGTISWRSDDWGTIPLVVEGGQARAANIPPNYNSAVVLLGKEIKSTIYAFANNAWTKVSDINETSAGWAAVYLPDNTEKVVVFNNRTQTFVAFVTWVKLP